jgi:hypothetical protein
MLDRTSQAARSSPLLPWFLRIAGGARRSPELDSDLSPRLRAPARVPHHAQDAVDAEPAMLEAGVGAIGFRGGAPRGSRGHQSSGGVGTTFEPAQRSIIGQACRSTDSRYRLKGCHRLWIAVCGPAVISVSV